MKLNKKEILDKIIKVICENKLIKINVSNPIEKDNEVKKINIKPVRIKDLVYLQNEKFINNKAFHENSDINKFVEVFSDILDNYKQIHIREIGSDHQILKGKNIYNMKSISNSEKSVILQHDNKKNYILEEGIPVPFLIKLGIMDGDGKVFKRSFDKFKQINKYLEFIKDTIDELIEKKLINDSIKVVDFGCGKSYLTFALYHFLSNITKLKFTIIGLDLKEDVIKNCNKIAQELNYSNLEFLNGDIKNFNKLNNVDLIFSLHACNNATDYALLKGLELDAKAILAVPCCQHEFNEKMSKNKNSLFFATNNPIGKHGILFEKYATLATDAFRALALELCGYKTSVMEFIDMEHTPKNVLIKSIKEKNISNEKIQKSKEEYVQFKNYLGFEPLLDSLLSKYYIKAID